MTSTEAAPPSISGAHFEEKVSWTKEMRKRFSPDGVCNADGSINQEFFKPKRIIIQLSEDKRWGPAEKEALYKGLEKHGVGRWREIIQEHQELKRYDEQYIRIKVARLLGIQSLARHMGWKGDRAAVEKEHAKHRQLGEELGCWKGGMLVENESGSVSKALGKLLENK